MAVCVAPARRDDGDRGLERREERISGRCPGPVMGDLEQIDGRQTAREQAREAGIKAWMMKPFDKHQLLEMVARFALP